LSKNDAVCTRLILVITILLAFTASPFTQTPADIGRLGSAAAARVIERAA
jgi:hypothetical protein